MKLWSDSWANGERIPQRCAAGQPDGAGRAGFGANRNPHLAWSELPAGTHSLVLICHDFDVPSRADDVNQPGREIPAELPRVDFFHWVLIDLPPTSGELAEGALSTGFTPRGKPGPALPEAQAQALPGFGHARQGLNDYTGWFADNADLAGDYFGYDGPFPPWNDSLVHHYVFTLYALSLPRLSLEGRFDGPAVRAQLPGRVLGEATLSGTYTLNARLLPA